MMSTDSYCDTMFLHCDASDSSVTLNDMLLSDLLNFEIWGAILLFALLVEVLVSKQYLVLVIKVLALSRNSLILLSPHEGVPCQFKENFAR